MTIAFRLFLGLLLIAPAFLAGETLLLQGVLTAYVTLMLLVIASLVRPGEAIFLASAIRPFALTALLVAAVFLLQLVPLPAESWRHPIWQSAEAALGNPVWGSVSIGPGDTLIALGRFLSACGLFAVAAAVSIERQRAETFLFILLALTTALALLLAVHNAGGFVFLGEINSTGPRAPIAMSASMASILSLAVLVYAIERYETRHSRPDFSYVGYVVALTGGTLCFVIALLTVMFYIPPPQAVAMWMGIGTVLMIVGFRRAGVPAKLGALIPAATLGIPALVAATKDHALSIGLSYAADAVPALAEATQRIIGDTGLLGAGAGTFADLAPLYTDMSLANPVAPTFAAASIVGFGWPLTLIFIGAAVLAIVSLVYSALNRGRDSFYTAAAAGCLVTALLEAFIDSSLLHSTGQILIVAVLGLGVAQSASRTVR